MIETVKLWNRATQLQYVTGQVKDDSQLQDYYYLTLLKLFHHRSRVFHVDEPVCQSPVFEPFRRSFWALTKGASTRSFNLLTMFNFIGDLELKSLGRLVLRWGEIRTIYFSRPHKE